MLDFRRDRHRRGGALGNSLAQAAAIPARLSTSRTSISAA